MPQPSPRIAARFITLGLCLLLATSFATPLPVFAKQQKKDLSITHKPLAHGKSKVQHQRSSSEESTAERDKRLYRECKGRPNAGACLGYATP